MPKCLKADKHRKSSACQCAGDVPEVLRLRLPERSPCRGSYFSLPVTVTFANVLPDFTNRKGRSGLRRKGERMEETNKLPDKAEEPVLSLRDGNTTFLIGIHFNQSSKETLDDKVKKLIRDEVRKGNI